MANGLRTYKLTPI